MNGRLARKRCRHRTEQNWSSSDEYIVRGMYRLHIFSNERWSDARCASPSMAGSRETDLLLHCNEVRSCRSNVTKPRTLSRTITPEIDVFLSDVT